MKGAPTMRNHPVGVCFELLIVALSVLPAFAQPPDHFVLHQNDPDPFCGETVISMEIPVQVHGELSVWNPDSTTVVRTLPAGTLLAGYHTVIWDGRNDQGDPLPDGSYPYVLVAAEAPGEPPVFTDGLRARIECATPTLLRSWGAVRAGYGP